MPPGPRRSATFSYYCPLTPSSGPMFGVDTDVTLLENPVARAVLVEFFPRDTSIGRAIST